MRNMKLGFYRTLDLDKDTRKILYWFSKVQEELIYEKKKKEKKNERN